MENYYFDIFTDKSPTDIPKVVPLTCHGHSRPVTHLSFSSTVEDDQYYFISSCKGKKHLLLSFTTYPLTNQLKIITPCSEMASRETGTANETNPRTHPLTQSPGLEHSSATKAPYGKPDSQPTPPSQQQQQPISQRKHIPPSRAKIILNPKQQSLGHLHRRMSAHAPARTHRARSSIPNSSEPAGSRDRWRGEEATDLRSNAWRELQHGVNAASPFRKPGH
jgi:hypothetical protein